MRDMLALERGDINIENRTLKDDRQVQRNDGLEYTTTPKTDKGNRVIELQEFLCNELEDYFAIIYKIDEHTRLFNITKSYLHHEMDRGSKAAGVKRIRIHDLRHSACAALIELGFSPVQIAERLGHESATITMRYAHLYPSVQRTMADKLNEMFHDESDIEDDDESEESEE